MRTGVRSKRPLALADLPDNNCETRRDAWWKLATASLKALVRRELTFAEIEGLHAAARLEAVLLLAESRRRKEGLTIEQLERIEDVITSTLAAKSKILVRLGLSAESSPAASNDPWASLAQFAQEQAPAAPGCVGTSPAVFHLASGETAANVTAEADRREGVDHPPVERAGGSGLSSDGGTAHV